MDESCITALIGGAETGKSETLVACINAVLWQQGLIFAQNPNAANLGTINTGKTMGGPQGDTPRRACVLVSAPTNTQVDNLLSHVHDECYHVAVFRDRVLGDHSSTLVATLCPTDYCPTRAGVL